MKKRWYGIIASVMALLVLVSTAVPALAQSEEEVTVDSEPTLTAPNVLGLRVQWVALVSEEVTMTALQRGTQELVEGAGIWALTREEAEVLREEWVALRESGEVAPQEGDYESLVSIHGEFLGRTNGSGQLKHAFDEAGGYLLVVIKQGYRPGFNFIRVKPIPQANEAPDTLEPTQ